MTVYRSNSYPLRPRRVTRFSTKSGGVKSGYSSAAKPINAAMPGLRTSELKHNHATDYSTKHASGCGVPDVRVPPSSLGKLNHFYVALLHVAYLNVWNWLAPLPENKKENKDQLLSRVRSIQGWFPTSTLYSPVDSTPIVWRPWGMLTMSFITPAPLVTRTF